MNALSKLILEKYQVRKTKKQKTEFIELLKKELKGHRIQVEEGGMCHSRNIIVGDLNNCEIVLGAHYDTAPELPFPNFLSPKNFLAYIAYMILLMIGFGIVTVVVMNIYYLFLDEPMLSVLLSNLFILLMIGWMMFGKANPHTANDNTSGVITLIEALHNPAIKDKVCCVFFDHEELGLFGSSLFAKVHKDELRDKLVMNFDCVSDGDHMMFVVNKKAAEYNDKLAKAFTSNGKKKIVITKASTTLYPSDQMSFKKNIGVAAFKKAPLIGYYMNRIHTRRDIIFDEENIKLLVRGLEKFVK